MADENRPEAHDASMHPSLLPTHTEMLHAVRGEFVSLVRKFVHEHGVSLALCLVHCAVFMHAVRLSKPIPPLTTGFLAAFCAIWVTALGFAFWKAPKPPEGAPWWRWRVPRALALTVALGASAWAIAMSFVEPGLALRYVLEGLMTTLPIACVLVVSWPEWTRAGPSDLWRLAGYLFLANLVVDIWVGGTCSLQFADEDMSHSANHFAWATVVAVLMVFLEAFVAWLLVHDLSATSWCGSLPMLDVARGERAWISRRRASVGLHAPGEPGTPAWQPVGLCLSGGGIRSASVCLGFLRGFDRAGMMPSVDYLSTVSGGGWAGSAFMLSLLRATGTSTRAEPDALVSPEGWAATLRRFRLRGDYVVPGGLGLTTNTLVLLISWLWGAVTNFVSGLILAFSATAWLKHLDASDGVAERLIDLLSSRQPFVTLFLNDPKDPLVDTLKMLNLVAVLFVGACVGLCAGLGLMFLGYFSFARMTYGATVRFTALSLRVAILSGGLLALLHGRREVTLLLLAGILVSLLPRFTTGLTAGQKALGVGVLLVGQRLFIDVRGPLHWVTVATHFWHHALVVTLTAPLRLAEWIGNGWSDPYQFTAGLGLLLVTLTVFLADPNRTSVHAFWREQLRTAFLDGTDMQLQLLNPEAQQKLNPWALRGAPLPLFNCALNTPGSEDGVLSKRGTARLEMSPLFVGGPSTGWAPTESYSPFLTWGSAVAVSAAAVNSQAGAFVGRAARMAMMIANLRLGIWIRNPRGVGHPVRFRNIPRFWAAYALRELFGANNETDPLIFVSDGGHHDNLGLNSLVDRGCKVIVSIDAGADPAWNCPDIARAARVLRVDGGWTLEGFDVDDVRPPAPGGAWADRLPRAPVVIARLRRAEECITLVYVKAGLVDELPADVRQYAEANPVFPQQSTSEQFFDEARFEAYRMVGEALAARAAEAMRKDDVCQAVLAAQRMP